MVPMMLSALSFCSWANPGSMRRLAVARVTLSNLLFVFIIIFDWLDAFFGLYLDYRLLGGELLIAGTLQFFDLRSVFGAIPF